nr:PepSY-associated TM helix domain-containing protein [Altericroceibacterium xinjiangense]
MKSQFNEIRATDVPRQERIRQKRGIPAFWKRQFHTWHWMSSAICLVGMLLFAITGITLNHAASIESEAVITSEERTLPAASLEQLRQFPADAETGTALPAELSDWLSDELGIDATGRASEWSEQELYVPLPRAGGDGWVSIDRETGEVLYEDTDRGWIAYLNDLHKGRDTGVAWSWFIDIFAAATIVFSLTGFLLLQIHAGRRPSTWPIVGAGVIIPLFLLIFLVH